MLKYTTSIEHYKEVQPWVHTKPWYNKYRQLRTRYCTEAERRECGYAQDRLLGCDNSNDRTEAVP
jgi:hypothetical protein